MSSLKPEEAARTANATLENAPVALENHLKRQDLPGADLRLAIRALYEMGEASRRALVAGDRNAGSESKDAAALDRELARINDAISKIAESDISNPASSNEALAELARQGEQLLAAREKLGGGGSVKPALRTIRARATAAQDNSWNPEQGLGGHNRRMGESAALKDAQLADTHSVRGISLKDLESGPRVSTLKPKKDTV